LVFLHQINNNIILTKKDFKSIKKQRLEFMNTTFKDTNFLETLILYKKVIIQIKEMFINEITGKNKMVIAEFFYGIEDYFNSSILSGKKINEQTLTVIYNNLSYLIDDLIYSKKDVSILQMTKFIVKCDLIYIKEKLE